MANLLLAKVESAAQAVKVSALAGQTATVTKVSATTNLATLTPAAPGQAAVVVKLDAARQVTEMQALLGKGVVIGKSPVAIGGIGNWITLYPAAKAGAAGAGIGADMVMMKVEGAAAATQLPALAGKSFVVAQPPVAAGTKAAAMLYLKPVAGGELVAVNVQNAMGHTAGLVGKTFAVAPSPVVGGAAGKFLVLTPVPTAAAVGKAAASGVVAAKATPASALGGGGAAALGGGLMVTSAGTVNPIAAATAGSGMLGAKGIGLGLGLGLGAWGPVALGLAAVVGATVLYTQIRRRHGAPDVSDEELLAAAKED